MKCEVKLASREDVLPIINLSSCEWGILTVGHGSVRAGSPVVKVGSNLLYFPREGLWGTVESNSPMQFRRPKQGESITLTF